MSIESQQVVDRAPKVSKFTRLGQTLLTAASLVFVLLLVEFPALIGVVDYQGIIGPRPADWFAGANLNDPELIHIHRPHWHLNGAARGGVIARRYQIPPSDMTLYQWDVKYDDNGFRNEFDLKRADLVVIGDSFVEEITIPAAQLTTSLLARLQGQVVANLGQSDYGPPHELVVLKRYGLPLHPRSVVWMFYEGNDLSDVLRYRGLIVARHEPHGRSFWSEFLARSFTTNALAQLKTQFKHAFKPAGVTRSAAFRASDGKKVTLYFAYASPPLSEQDLSALDETASTIAVAHKLCAAQGTRLIFVFVPTKFRVFRDYCEFPQRSECRNWTVNDLPERLKKAVASISPDIGFLDLTPRLAEDVRNGALPYYLDDDHWSPEGNRIAAEAINNYLESTRTRQNNQLVSVNHE
jgi:hypothetical protein